MSGVRRSIFRGIEDLLTAAEAHAQHPTDRIGAQLSLSLKGSEKGSEIPQTDEQYVLFCWIVSKDGP